MTYVLLFTETAEAMARRSHPEQSGPYWGAWTAYIGAMNQAGVMRSGNGLQPPDTATTLRIRDGRRHVQDGPFADAKEQLAGYVVLDLPDLDAALEWAARAPCAAEGAVEVRPVLAAASRLMDGARDPSHVAEQVARVSYGRLVALLATRTRDIAAAEDALADAFHQALRTWPGAGIPDRPEAWLLTVARRAAGHATRHGAVRTAAAATLAMLHDEATSPADTAAFPDERLKLLFVCAHPAIDDAARTPLMLQTVLGLDAARIAGAFVTSPAAMAQRLVRAKTRIRAARIRFEPPGLDELDARLTAVLDAIYAAFGAGWDDTIGTGLTAEAIFLGRLVVQLLPAQPEARGLLALMLHCEARRPARRSPAGAFVPLADQDTTRWNVPLAAEAEHHLVTAATANRPGRYQIEAAIQSLHAQRAHTNTPNPHALLALYTLLLTHAPTLGAQVSHAAIYAEIHGPEAGLTHLDALDPAAISAYQPYWAVRAHLLRCAGHPGADSALQRAIGLSDDPAVRAYLAGQVRMGIVQKVRLQGVTSPQILRNATP